MNQRRQAVGVGNELARRDAMDAVHLIRPDDPTAAVLAPAAKMGEALCFVEKAPLVEQDIGGVLALVSCPADT